MHLPTVFYPLSVSLYEGIKKENFQEYVTRTQKEIVGIESKIEEEELKKLQLEHKMQRLQNITEYKVNKERLFFTVSKLRKLKIKSH